MSSCYTRNGRLAVAADSDAVDVEPHGPYFSLPRNTTDGRPPLTRRGTTKELIGRFESMSSSSREPIKPPTHSTGRFGFRGGPSTTAGNRDKKRSPLRQSIRNILSVFSKKYKASLKDQLEESMVPGTRYRPNIGEHAASPPPDIAPEDSAPAPQAELEPSNSRYHISLCTTPISPGSTLSGPLLYLSRPERSDLLPVWTACIAILHTTHVLITWHTGHGNPETFIVPFVDCADVRSLSVADLDTTERTLLPTGTDLTSLKVFELLFEGRPREKFAASSMKERATWVSAIWDAVLQKQEPKSPRMHSVVVPFTPNSAMRSRVSLPVTHEENGIVVHDPSVFAQSPTERALPPIPGSAISLPSVFQDSPIKSETRASALSPLPVPPRTPITPISLRESPCTPSGSLSPSVRNLGQLSVVKQRLAQIEHTRSEESPLSKRTPEGANSPTPSRRSAFARDPTNGRLLRHGSEKSGVERSIIDSYGGSELVSPLSVRSGRATSLASSCGSPTRTKNFWENEPRTRPASQFLDIPTQYRSELSPTSRDSSDAKSEHKISGAWDEDPPARLTALGDMPHLIDSTYKEAVITAQEQGHAAERVAARPALSIDTGSSEHHHTASRNMRRDNVALDSPLRKTLKLGVPGSSNKSEQSLERPSDTNFTKALESVHRSLGGLKELAGTDDVKLNDIRSRVDAIFNEVKLQSIAQGADASESLTIGMARVLKELEAMHSDLKTNFPRLMKLVDELRNTRPSADVVELRDVKSSKSSDQPVPADWLAVHAKLDGLMTACQSLQTAKEQTIGGDSMADREKSRESLEILNILQVVQTQWSAQTEQQTDSIRYLNELNSWLEAFVNHGTSQIEGIAAGVQQLCRELGTMPTQDGEILHTGLLSDIRTFLAENRAREDNSASLQSSVNGLIAAVHEDLRTNAEARNALTTESIVGLIDRQRHDHERMLKAIASELSNDIRGERLRFVEAMKEATAINVQVHVEEFKKELTREVLLMTQEVGRLQKERQTLEQQIADLFAFYTKQKQDGEMKPGQFMRMPETPPQAQASQPVQPRGRRNHQERPQLHIATPAASGATPPIRRRPLPTPSPSPSRPPSSIR
ncbi:hypothetical protein OBBRIDRAFT_886367 [Obba rivulosa]|uniref:PH domain-containing protein n=1 Tax=Obba rivulosa TaxID=1052685 RepID=A0A8E2DMM0_9APHY|nr:hypothetical protein OBBRIDRAFT_886367 [Obba rivulosa]